MFVHIIYMSMCLCRLRACGLLPLARLVEGDRADLNIKKKDKQTRFSYDRSLLTALLDRWRPETHTFHLPVGEMTPTLQDVSMILGLPLAGRAVGAMDVPSTWREDLLQRFADVQRIPGAPAYQTFDRSKNKGPPKSWVVQFSVSDELNYVSFKSTVYIRTHVCSFLQADYMRPDVDDETVSRHLEAYLLWLFGFVMFCSSSGNCVGKFLLPYARWIAESDPDSMPQFSWGSAVLAATYRGMCNACIKDGQLPILDGCPLLLQLWSYERFPVGRPVIDPSPYNEQGYHGDPIDMPTMGSYWCRRKVKAFHSYANYLYHFI